ncbi:MAG: saccharopine dehydrogenase [Desulfobacteraceae bacterium 4572_123]|nr:MAG: saccharopine dehydrogenase [Desulfobacteraceae bacterium 4572_123]
MKILCLGAAGKISRESVHDLVEYSNFEKITIADYNEDAGLEVVKWLDDPRVDFVKIDVNDRQAAVATIKGYDLVMDGTTISLNDRSTACIAEAGVDGINLNGCGAEWEFDREFSDNGKICIPGMGMTPGITNMMTRHAADQLETVDTIRISHGAFRPVAFSPAIAETTRIEYDPDLPSRVVYENGKFVQIPPFARPREIELPPPFGTHVQYIIPHAETMTLPKSLADKQIQLIEVRGTWPPANMTLIRTLYDWGFMRNDRIEVDGVQVGILDAVADYLLQSKEGQTTDLYGYALHVEVTGIREGKKYRHLLTHTHPASDGSVKGWEKLRAYTRCVGIPMSIGAQMIESGRIHGTGVIAPELAFDPSAVFTELARRDIKIHEKIEDIPSRKA